MALASSKLVEYKISLTKALASLSLRQRLDQEMTAKSFKDPSLKDLDPVKVIDRSPSKDLIWRLRLKTS